MTGWHVTPELTAAYAAAELDDVQSWSVEAHLEGCAGCARAVSAATDPAPLARVRAAVLAQVCRPARGFVRLTVAPTLTVSWLLSVVGVVLGVLALDRLEPTGVPLLLLVAPLLPLLGLAVGCSPPIDRSAELLASTPMPALRVLLLRCAAVLMVSVPPLLLVSLLAQVGPLPWLAPSAGLVALSLALSTRLRIEVATGCAAGLWAAVALGPAAMSAQLPLALDPALTAVWMGVALAGLVLLVVRRERLDDLTVPSRAFRYRGDRR